MIHINTKNSNNNKHRLVYSETHRIKEIVDNKWEIVKLDDRRFGRERNKFGKGRIKRL